MIAIHEFGHFGAAKLFKIRVNEFAIGMGPAIWKKQGKETLYSIRAIPMGGFCQMEGEDSDSDDERAFNKAAWYKRFIVVAAGAFLNIVLGFIIFAVIASSKATYTSPVIGNVIESSYLDEAGFMAGDTIVEVDGSIINIYDDLAFALRNVRDKEVKVVAIRNGERIEAMVTPSKQDITYIYGENECTIVSYVNGIENGRQTIAAPDNDQYKNAVGTTTTQSSYILGFNMKTEQTTPLSVIQNAFYSTIYNIKIVYVSLYELILGITPASQISGPIGIIDVIGQASRINWVSLFSLVALLTVNLGIMNLLPIPALDGCKLLIILVEAITRKKLPPEREGVIQLIGFGILISIMIFATYNDIVRIFTS